MKLHAQHWGPQRLETEKEAEKLLLLHGMGGTGALWRPIAALLEDTVQILAPDQRGHGRSRIADPDTGYSPLDYAGDVVETLETTGFFPTWIAGHSMGVRTACGVSHLRPEWVKGLVLIDLGLCGPAGGGLHQNLSTFIAKLPEKFPSREAARRFMLDECPDPAIGQYLMAVSVRDAQGEVSFPFDHAALLKTLDASHEFSLREWVRAFGETGKPVLLLRGARSKVWSHTEFEDEKRRFADLPSIRFEELADAGHGLPFEKRQEFVELLRRFIAD